jgi:hypothetical protein
MLTGPELFAAARDWLEDHADGLSALGIDYEVNDSPGVPERRPIWIVMESADRLSEVILWPYGHAEVQFAATATGMEPNTMHELSTAAEVGAVLESLQAWMVGGSASGPANAGTG